MTANSAFSSCDRPSGPMNEKYSRMLHGTIFRRQSFVSFAISALGSTSNHNNNSYYVLIQEIAMLTVTLFFRTEFWRSRDIAYEQWDDDAEKDCHRSPNEENGKSNRSKQWHLYIDLKFCKYWVRTEFIVLTLEASGYELSTVGNIRVFISP
jgi:hypothetical protein